MIRIAVDVYGGDNAPGCVIDGALEALRAMDDVSILFCGAQAERKGRAIAGISFRRQLHIMVISLCCLCRLQCRAAGMSERQDPRHGI